MYVRMGKLMRIIIRNRLCLLGGAPECFNYYF